VATNKDLIEKAEMSVPTVSGYLKTISAVNILIATRKGPWTYYKRNEKLIQDFSWPWFIGIQNR